jgi:basic membrane protein A
MIKRTDNAIYDMIGKLVKGELKGGTTLEYGLKEDGVGISPMTYTKSEVPAEFLTKIEDIKAKIISGEIKVTDVTKK